MRQRDGEGEARESDGTMTHCKEPRVEETTAGREADARQRDRVWGAGLPQLLENPEKPQTEAPGILTVTHCGHR